MPERMNGKRGGDAQEQHHGAEDLNTGSFNASGTNPLPTQQPEQKGQAEGAQAEQLETEIRSVRSCQANQVLSARGAGDRIPGRILGMIGGQTESQEQACE